MKTQGVKIILPAIGILFILFSCKKTYTCTCSFSSGKTQDYQIGPYKKKDADKECTKIGTSTSQTTGSNITCKLK